MYGIGGERRLPEFEIPWLAGYEGSKPVRIGNAAAAQLQLDVYGELMDALYQACKGGLAGHDIAWGLQRALLEHLDEGLGAARRGHLGGARAAAAFHPFEGDGLGRVRPRGSRWSRASACRRRSSAGASCASASTPTSASSGFSRKRNAFVQSYGSRRARREPAADRAHRLPAGDRPAGGLHRRSDPQRELTVDGLVLRYRTHESRRRPAAAARACSSPAASGSPTTCACRGAGTRRASCSSAWSASPTTSACSPRNTTRSAKRFLGNFPQAFSHVGAGQHRDEPRQPREAGRAARGEESRLREDERSDLTRRWPWR